MRRRKFFQLGATTLLGVGLADYLGRNAQRQTLAQANRPGRFPLTRTEAEWRRRLTAQQFQILRQQGTEMPFTSPLNKEYGKGTFACAGCALPLFSSQTKFDSGTGWPSFYAPMANAVGTRIDKSHLMTRTEVHCRRCGGHLGHVFNDGPAPTGLRYCINGVALKFLPT
jgi:peptide-methionine (R)-S-oxide reductase